MKKIVILIRKHFLLWEFSVTNVICYWGFAILKNGLLNKREKKGVCFSKEARTILSALRGRIENVSQSRSGRSENASQGPAGEGGIARIISSAGSLPGPSLTGGPTSRVRPLPIQITLIGDSPCVYVSLLWHQKNGHGERKGAHPRKWKKMNPNLAGVDKKNRISKERWKSRREQGEIEMECAIRRIMLAIAK